jgi:hypothetical protein
MAIFNQQTINVNTPSIMTGTTAFNNNPARTGWSIVNCGTNVLYVLMGTGASTTVFHVPLKAGTGTNDGTGGSVGQETGVIFTGPITVAGTSPSYVTTEFAA